MINDNFSNKKNINLSFEDVSILPILLGANNRNLAIIESLVNVNLDSNGDTINIFGDNNLCETTKIIIEEYYYIIKNDQNFDLDSNDETLKNVIRNITKSKTNRLNFKDKNLTVKTWKKIVTPKTKGHEKYFESLNNNDLVFCLGPAGTGKTYIAVAKAVSYLMEKKVERIILSRPAVESGEKLGFLPGDIKDKVDPYLRPIYDALYDMMPYDRVEKKIESGEIEIAPLAYMRGRTLANSYVIIDEAQNTTPIQMKMLVTRIGEGSKMVVTGDPSQVDLDKSQRSGLNEAVNKLKNLKGIDTISLSGNDVVRHHLVAKIIEAYEKNQ